MPRYDYHCEANDRTIELVHSIAEVISTWGDVCRRAKINPGTNWNHAIDYIAQPGLKAHHRYLRQLYIDDQLVMGGPLPDGVGSMVLIRTGSLEEATKLVQMDPGVQTKVITVEVMPWDVTMSSVRVVRRKPQPPEDDSEQSFHVKRIDLESRLNIEP